MLWKANNVTFAYVCIFIWFYYKQLNNKLRDLYHNYHQSVHSVCPCVCNNNDKTSFVYIGVGCEINYVSFGLSWTSIMGCVYNYYISYGDDRRLIDTKINWTPDHSLFLFYFLFSPSSVSQSYTLGVSYTFYTWKFSYEL